MESVIYDAEETNIIQLPYRSRGRSIDRTDLTVVPDTTIIDVCIDMDGVLTDFEGSENFRPSDKVMRKPPRSFEKGFFENLDVLPGARWAIRVLLKNPNLRVQILTKPVHRSYLCYSEKVAWIAKNFPELLERITITHDKSLLAAPGRILIDDYAQDWQAGWEERGGRFIHFQTKNSAEHWEAICRELAPDCFTE